MTSAPSRSLSSLRLFGREFLQFMGPRAWGAGTLLLLGALVEGIGLLLLLPILTVVLGTGSGAGWIDRLAQRMVDIVPGASPVERLAVLLVLFAGLLAVRSAIMIKRDVTLVRLQVGFVESLRLRIISLIANTRWDVVARLKHGRVTHVLGGDIQDCGQAAHLILQASVNAAMLAAQLVLVLLLSPALAAVVVLLLGCAALALRPVMRRARTLGAELTETNLALVTSTTQFLGGLKLALSQNLQRAFVVEFAETLSHAGSRRVEFQRQRTRAQVALTSAAALVAGIAMLIGVGLLHASPAALIGFLFVLARMNGPVMVIQSAAPLIVHSLPAYGKIRELQTELEDRQNPEPAGAGGGGRLKGRVEFRGVSFTHREWSDGDGAGGVSQLDIDIEPGAFIGIKGASGAGKTTFADLLVGLYPPQAGEVRVAGKPLEGAHLHAWRRSVSYVSQDPFLFHDTVRRNLLWARPEAGEEALWAALRRAGAEALVKRMPEGLETLVGERGTLVSGGERQRIALTRAILREPALLVLDEATNAIDVEGEARILLELSSAPDRPTIVMIAHRESSLAHCDRVFEFQSGRLIEA